MVVPADEKLKSVSALPKSCSGKVFVVAIVLESATRPLLKVTVEPDGYATICRLFPTLAAVNALDA